MKDTRQYVFDFCGTIVSKQTHSLLKYYFFRKFELKYFLKYTKKKSEWMQFDVEYIDNMYDISDLANYILLKNQLTLTSRFIKKKLSNDEIIILTIANKRLVSKLLKLIGIYNFKIHGSESNYLIDGFKKGNIISNYKNIYFFTDSMNDIHCFKYSDLVIYSEYSQNELIHYVKGKNNFCDIKNFKI